MAHYWILKTDTDTYDFTQLERERRTVWDGVRNALALKHIRNMTEGDRALIYHSGKEKSLVGLARIVRGPYPDPAPADDTLVVVDIEAEGRLPTVVPLATVKADPGFADLGLVRLPRLSVIPVAPVQWARLLALGGVR
jgi:predicted RNA-binding protein with PUA-like domain